MKRVNLLNKLINIYGNSCVLCNVNLANTVMPIVAHKSLSTARQINKRPCRSKLRRLPEFSTWHIENVLSVCFHCCDRNMHSSIYERHPVHVLKTIDQARLGVGFLLLTSFMRLRQFRFALYNKLILKVV